MIKKVTFSLLLITLVGCGVSQTQTNNVIAEDNNKPILIEVQEVKFNGGWTEVKIIRDTETGVEYFLVTSDTGTIMQPRLGSDEKPLIAGGRQHEETKIADSN